MCVWSTYTVQHTLTSLTQFNFESSFHVAKQFSFVPGCSNKVRDYSGQVYSRFGNETTVETIRLAARLFPRPAPISVAQTVTGPVN